MLTLWGLLPSRSKPPKPRKRANARSVQPARDAVIAARKPANHARADARSTRPTMRQRYDAMTRQCLAEHSVRVRRWRSSMSGCAWEVRYHNGDVSRLIEAPRPRGPMSAAIFLHEIGHHAIGFGRWRPRCLEELKAWEWALAEMERRGLNVTDAVRRRMRESLIHAVAKARRRGLKRLPEELTPYAVAR